ncbi:MAG: hypothetical protein ACO1N3_03545 [Gammaproteobacteria bacterium]
MKTRMLLIVGFLVIPFVVQATEQNDMTRPINNLNAKAVQKMKQLKESNGFPGTDTKPRNFQGNSRVNQGTN